MKNLPLLIGSWAIGLALVAQAPATLPPHMDQSASTPVTASVPDDPALAQVIAPLSAQIHATFGKVIASCPKGIGKGSGLGDHPLGCFLADVMREGGARAVGAEVRFAFTNAGGVRRNLPPGDIHVQDIYEILPFDNELVVAEYTGAEVIAIVKEGIEHKGGEPCSGVHASVTGTVEHPVVTITWSDGSAIDPKATYRAATTDYLLANGDSTPTLKAGRNAVPTGVPVRQLVIDACAALGRARKPLEPDPQPRYVLSPEIAAAIEARTFKF